jgi:hypothetical protein
MHIRLNPKLFSLISLALAFLFLGAALALFSSQRAQALQGEQPGQPLDPSELPVEGQRPGDPAAPVVRAIPVQGRLTDANGVVINGSRTITMTMYTASTGGVELCQDSDGVVATNGLFNTYLDFCTPTDLNGQQVYLGIRMQGEAGEMTPRQPVYLVPYAYSLINGANIGSLLSTANSEIEVSPQKMLQVGGAGLTLTPVASGGMDITAPSAGNYTVHVPMDAPAVVYGTRYKLASARVCYRVQNVNSFISGTQVRYINDSGAGVDLLSETAARTSTSWTCYTSTPPVPGSIDGSLVVRLNFSFANSADVIQVGRLTLTLTQQ